MCREIIFGKIILFKSINCLIFKLVELKSGDTYNGTLENCDRFMNFKLSDCILTTKV